MGDGDGVEGMFGQDGGGDGEHGAEGEGRVGCVGEVGDGFAVEVVSRCAWQSFSPFLKQGLC